MTERVQYAYQDRVATVTLNDGKANIMSTAMLSDINQAIDQAEQAEAIIVLRSGLPEIFSAGFDLKIFAANDAEGSLAMVKAGAELALRLLAYPYPTIGMLEGHAFPMGAFLLLSCDLRLASAGSARIGLNEVAIGISPPGFAIELSRARMHPAWHNRTVVLGEMFEPDDAVKAGLVDKVVPPASLSAVLEDILVAAKAVHMPSHALAKNRLRGQTLQAMRETIDRELTLEAYAARAQSSVVVPGREKAPVGAG